MEKRGELTSNQIISLVLVIAGFVIILIFILVFLDTDSYQQDELCKLSILTRATAPDVAQRVAPLKCTTKKYCISKGDDCEQFIGEKNIEKINLPSNENAAARKIEETTANAMFDCWNIMGQGKLDLFGGGKDTEIIGRIPVITNIFQARSSCVICSRVALSEKVAQDVDILSRVDVNRYMQNTTVPNSDRTYLNTLTDRQINSYPQAFESNFTFNITEPQKIDEMGVIFMQILTGEQEWLAAGVESAAYTGTFIFAGTSGLGPFGLLTMKASALTAVATSLLVGGIAGFQTSQSRQIAAGYCGSLTSDGSEGRSGCSITTSFDYKKVTQINDLCSIVEGTP